MSKLVANFVKSVTAFSRRPLEKTKLEGIGEQKMIEFHYLIFETFERDGVLYLNVSSIARDLSNVWSSNDDIIKGSVRKIDVQRILDKLLNAAHEYKNPLIINNDYFCEVSLAGDFLWLYRPESFVKWVHCECNFFNDSKGYLYAFIGIEKDTNQPVLKIGRSSDIERRFGNHHQKIDIKTVCYRKTDFMKNGEACLKRFLQNCTFVSFVQNNEWYYFEDYDTLDNFMKEHMVREIENAADTQSKNCCLAQRAILPNKPITIEEYHVRDVEDCLNETFAKWETEVI